MYTHQRSQPWLTVTIFALVAGCAPSQHSARTEAAFAADTTAEMVTALRAAQELAPTTSAVWPGFQLGEQVLILTAPSGTTALVGDPNPPADFRPLTPGARVHIREGPPPDSLTGLRTGMSWNGKTATAIGYAPSSRRMLETLIHEAFHTHQHSLEGMFPGGSTPQFPDTSSVALTLLNLEGRYLASALATDTRQEARAAVLSALAVRARRCALLGSDECEAERRIEQSEGSAAYVAALVLGHQRKALADSIRPAVSKIEDLPRLARFHFYDTGLAWLLLLDRIGPSDWKDRLGSIPPDSLLSEHLGFTPALADSLAQLAVRSGDAEQAQKDAQRALTAEAAFADSVARAFVAQPGTPVRIRWRSEDGTRRSQVAWIPEVRRSVNTAGQGGNRNTYVIGAREARYGFADQANQLVIRAPALWTCCRDQGVEIRTPVAGQVARVDGTAVPLEAPGGKATGALTLDLPAISFCANRAELSVHADSVTIWLR